MSTIGTDLLHLFIDQAPVAIAMFDRDMCYIAASRRWVSDYGLEGRNLRGLCHYDVFRDIPGRWREIHRRCLAGEVLAADEDRYDRAGGDVQWLRWEVRPWYGKDGIGGITIFAEDITQRIEDSTRAKADILRLNAELEQRVCERTAQLEQSVASLCRALDEAESLRKELREQAIRDPLTGLFNRRFLEETLAQEVSRATRSKSRFGILMFDIDHFKQLNDRFGHTAGDAVLRGIGRIALERVRRADVPCRFGGDEFVVVMPEASMENARSRGAELLGRLQHMHLEVLDTPLPGLEFSMGVASFPGNGDNSDELIRAADVALYRAKELGGGRVEAARSIPSIAV